MEFEILGPLRVRSNGGDLELGAPAQRELLAVLLTSPNVPISDDRLIDELWGDDPPPSARHLVQVYVSRLRAILGDTHDGPRIIRQGTGYAVRLAPGELDAERFLANLERGRALGEREPEVAERALAEGIGLWRGTPFVDLPTTPPAVGDEADRLERRHLEALEAWTEVRLGLGRHRELISELAALVDRYPYDEALHADLMLALYRCGRQAEALEVARALRARLREELGVDLSPEVRDLYHRILLQAPELALEPPPPPGNLPERLTSFVGRTWELREIAFLLDGSRHVTLTGPAGVGKTRLAIEVARQLRSRFPGGTWWVDLDPITDPDTVVEEVARVLGLTVPPGADLATVIGRRLRRRPALLLLDNCEHVAQAIAATVPPVLRTAPSSRILATSRVPLRSEGEQLWVVPPLGLQPVDDDPVAATESDAARLFAERGRNVDPSFVVNVEDAGTIDEICRRVDGLPLAIEMAAAHLSILTPDEIARRLDERSALLEHSIGRGSARHRSLQAAFDASYALLSDRERAAFEWLSVFVGPFDLDACTAIMPDGEGVDRAMGMVTALVEASMLTKEREGDRTRYRLLETLREYGVARLRAAGQEDDARRAHATYHLDLAERAGEAVNTPAFPGWEDRLSRAYAELCEALAWSLAHDDRRVTLGAARALRAFWYRRGDVREAGRWSSRMLEGDLGTVPGGLVAEVHAAAAFAADLSGDLTAAWAHAQGAVRLARQAGDPYALTTGLWAQAHVAIARGDLDATRRFAQEMLSSCRERGDRWGRAEPLAFLGMASLFGGAPGDAREGFEEALPLYRELADPANLVLMALSPLCLITLRQGDLATAERYAAEAVELATGTAWEPVGSVYYGEVLAASGDLEAADAFTLRALRSAFDSGMENWFRIALRDLAWTAAQRGRYEHAAILMAASRRNAPSYALDATIYGPMEERCREALDEERLVGLSSQGEAMDHQHLLDLVGADELVTV